LRDDPNWNQARIDSVLKGGINTPVRLARPIPVHLVYRTAWVDDAGTVQFRDDGPGEGADADHLPGREIRPAKPATGGGNQLQGKALSLLEA
jgi:hypothetical protein